jgi:hypothetical protein
MLLQFTCGDNVRYGHAEVFGVNREHAELSFRFALNAQVPAVAMGDSIYEYERPCARCRCKRCDALFALFCVEHDDCRTDGGLARACASVPPIGETK